MLVHEENRETPNGASVCIEIWHGRSVRAFTLTIVLGAKGDFFREGGAGGIGIMGTLLKDAINSKANLTKALRIMNSKMPDMLKEIDNQITLKNKKQ